MFSHTDDGQRNVSEKSNKLIMVLKAKKKIIWNNCDFNLADR